MVIYQRRRTFGKHRSAGMQQVSRTTREYFCEGLQQLKTLRSMSVHAPHELLAQVVLSLSIGNTEFAQGLPWDSIKLKLFDRS